MFGIKTLLGNIRSLTHANTNTNYTHTHELEEEHAIDHFHLAYHFELAVEIINSLAGCLIIFAVILAGTNLVVVGINNFFGGFYVFLSINSIILLQM